MSINTHSEFYFPEINKIARKEQTNIPKFISYILEYISGILQFNENTISREYILSLISQDGKLSKKDQRIFFFALYRGKISLIDVKNSIIYFIKKRSEYIYNLIIGTANYDKELFNPGDLSILIFAIENGILEYSNISLLEKSFEFWNLDWGTTYPSFRIRYENPNFFIDLQNNLI